ncbi:MAG: cobaltochelatase subunit CobN, partial [Methanospirillum sp.]|uniref:cobaltochelatase subunit CobN n=1 Tax=Methanospirillum sp. TaxID=45200 RepID=UPI00237468B7
ITLRHNPEQWKHATVEPEVITTCLAYTINNGDENFYNMLLYIRKTVLGEDLVVTPPIEIPWEGIYHPDTSEVFTRIDEYLNWYEKKNPTPAPYVGILFSRIYWAAANTAIEDLLIKTLEEEGLKVIPVFSMDYGGRRNSSKNTLEVLEEFLMCEGKPRVDAIIKLTSSLLRNTADPTENEESKITYEHGVDLYKHLDIPIFHPIISSYLTVEEWRESPSLTYDAAWAVAMPEFEGVIEPIYLGSSKSMDDGDYYREAVPDRARKISRRVKKWISLAQKPVSERKVTFIFHNNPCTGVEASVGGASHLDSLESVARIMHTMKDRGYTITPPENGETLIKTILEKKAISEFRWTTVEDIAVKGGTLMEMDVASFMPFFNKLPEKVQARIHKTWGDPPGLSMILNGKMLITGLTFGNASVHVQPKRGCYGPRCDGQVCKLLHDPGCPPPHQYLATYHWIEEFFGADVIVHVGTHGNLEFLPGKGLGLSEACYPDISIGTIPHLYIYNADNPPEGTIAKRRGYATLIDHMQTVLTQGGLYERLEELDNLLGQYENAKNDPSRAHALQHLIMDALAAANMDKDIHLSPDMPLERVVSACHDALSKIRNTQIPSGMHILGRLPEGEKRLDFINAIIRFDSGEPSPRRIIAQVMGLDLSYLLENQDKWSDEYCMSHGAILENLEATTKNFIDAIINGPFLSFEDHFHRIITSEQSGELDIIKNRILDINQRLGDSKEIEALLHGFSGGFTPPGPSGVISRGHEDVLPTGRNFYSMDPFKVPTKPAWRVGRRLADVLLQKYIDEEGKYPENIAFYWMSTDIMSSDGEMFSQPLWLLGVEPVWLANGHVKSFTIVPLEKLDRPRIDITVKTSRITLNNFVNCSDLLDEAISAVAELDEPAEMNFVRKHTLKSMEENGGSWRDATYRIFSGQPGGGLGGINLAIYASAWKTEKDLIDIFVASSGYAFGKGVQGQVAHEQFVSCLSSVSITFNKVHSDQSDLLGCCCYFNNHGGITAASRYYSDHEVKPYYGDTREPEHIEVRDLADEMRRVVRTKLLNPKWIEGLKEHGYKGAGDIMKRVTRVYGWEAATGEVDDWIFDDIANTFVNDEEMRQFFEDNNPYALEEIARRLLEAEQRGLWEADEQTLEDLKNNYLEIESWLEDEVGEGDHQGGSVDIMTADDIEGWGSALKEIMTKIDAKHQPRLEKR